MMIEAIPSNWAAELWAAAKTAGPFGNMICLIIIVVLWRALKKAQDHLLEVTVKGINAMNALQKALTTSRKRRRRGQNDDEGPPAKKGRR
jgi:hypothetical protein